jgi:hypothetical protein
MLHRALLFLLLLASSAAAEQAQYGKPTVPQSGSPARSQTACPWLTQGSASRLLAGHVSTKVYVSDTGAGSCRFLRQQGSHDGLEILVSKGALVSCPTGSTELKGIGNQAARCKAPGSHSGGVDMVSGRVRDLHFTVTRTSRGQKRSVKLSDVQEDALERIAEQIAGNLY